MTRNQKTTKQNKFLIGLLLLGVSALFSCGKNNKNIFPSISNADNAETHAKILRAKHSDIPLPMGCSAIYNNSIEDSSVPVEVMRANGLITLEEIQNFYKAEMEAQGWEINNFSTPYETIFVCNKPHKECVVTAISNNDSQTSSEIRILVKSKNAFNTTNDIN